jgi:hypothetical protein
MYETRLPIVVLNDLAAYLQDDGSTYTRLIAELGRNGSTAPIIRDRLQLNGVGAEKIEQVIQDVEKARSSK